MTEAGPGRIRGAAEGAMADKAARRVLEAWTERLAPASTERSVAWWEVNLGATLVF